MENQIISQNDVNTTCKVSNLVFIVKVSLYYILRDDRPWLTI